MMKKVMLTFNMIPYVDPAILRRKFNNSEIEIIINATESNN